MFHCKQTATPRLKHMLVENKNRNIILRYCVFYIVIRVLQFVGDVLTTQDNITVVLICMKTALHSYLLVLLNLVACVFLCSYEEVLPVSILYNILPLI